MSKQKNKCEYLVINKSKGFYDLPMLKFCPWAFFIQLFNIFY